MTERSINSINTDELIRRELDGKIAALGRYDTILWQVRSGYVIVLYGTLGLLFKDGINPSGLNLYIVLLIFGFSILAYTMDVAFRFRQLRVVKSYNQLVDHALRRSFGEIVDAESLQKLLFLSGESRTPLSRNVVFRAVFFIFTFYAFTPLAALIIFVAHR